MYILHTYFVLENTFPKTCIDIISHYINEDMHLIKHNS